MLFHPQSSLGRSLQDLLEQDPSFRTVAYFSMEVGIKTSIPTYAGGLGILAGDILKSAADLGVPMIGTTLLYRKVLYSRGDYLCTRNRYPSFSEKEESSQQKRLLPHRLL
jgi:glucan phosphorylase